MKKILWAILGVCALVSCGDINRNRSTDTHVNEDFDVSLRELTINGETHEYVRYDRWRSGSLSHWAGCRFCKDSLNRDTVYVYEFYKPEI